MCTNDKQSEEDKHVDCIHNSLVDRVPLALEVSLPLLLLGIGMIVVVKFCGKTVGMPPRKYPVYQDGWIYGENWEFNVRVGRGILHGNTFYN